MRFAREFHGHIDRRRKYSNQPYSVHLVQVAKIVASVTDDEEMIASICVLIVTGRRLELHRAPLPASAEDSRWHMGIPRTTTKQGGLK